MLKIVVPPGEIFNELTYEIRRFPGGELKLEHSLAAISKWESIHHKSYLSRIEELTNEEQLDYIKQMTLNEVNPDIYYFLTEQNKNDINEYINDPMTATHCSSTTNETKKNQIITSELMYYWLVSLRIPFEVQYWHINKMMSLIDVCSKMSSEGTKTSKKDTLDRYKQINEANKKKLNIKG